MRSEVVSVVRLDLYVDTLFIVFQCENTERVDEEIATRQSF